MNTNLSDKQRLRVLQRHSLINVRDLMHCILLLFMMVISWTVPEKFWRLFSLPLSRLYLHLFPKEARSKTNIIRKSCEDHFELPTPETLEVNRLANLFEARFQYVREYRPGGWKPCFQIHGKKHIEESLEKGKGAILWIAPFHFTELAVKKGFAQSGFDLTYLSIYRHGFSTTRFGLKFLNPIWKKVENKYLYERIVIQPDGRLSYLRKLERRLRENGLVALGCTPSKGQKTIEQKILNGIFPLPTGAASLALVTNASLLPVFLIRRSSGEFDLIIEAPIEIPSKESRHEEVNVIMADFSKLIEGYLIKNPTSFRFWDHEKGLR